MPETCTRYVTRRVCSYVPETYVQNIPYTTCRMERRDHVRTVVRNFVPVFLSRGVVQISDFVDEMIATLEVCRNLGWKAPAVASPQ